jgi:SAM-dependent methyltransferase
MKVADRRTQAQILEHYHLETLLANELRTAPQERRPGLYTTLYDRLFAQLPHHPQIAHRQSKIARRAQAERQANFLSSINPGNSFLEIGAGDCFVSLSMCARSRDDYAVDVSAKLAPCNPPKNFHLVLSDGCSVLPTGTQVSLAFSNQLMEHLHPDDAVEQLENIYCALEPGGKYFCVTPSRISGPHDVSQHFDDEARGFHLKEYTYAELSRIMRLAGFDTVHTYIGVDGRYLRVPSWSVRTTEWFVGRFKQPLRRKIGQFGPFRLMLGLRLLATKPLVAGPAPTDVQ